jgi:uncharacterized membrane protein
MKRSALVFDLVSLVSFGGLVGYTTSVYDALPARMAVHFNLHGVASGWMDRAYATWGFDVFVALFWAAVRFAPRWLPDSNGWKERADKSPIVAMAMLTMILLAGVGAFIVWNGLHPEAPRGPVLGVLLGTDALGLSVILPRTRRNPLLGVRTAFSLASDENWSRTHRIASYTFALGGVACIACGLAGLTAVALCAFIAGALAPAVYSWVLQYRLPPEA